MELTISAPLRELLHSILKAAEPGRLRRAREYVDAHRFGSISVRGESVGAVVRGASSTYDVRIQYRRAGSVRHCSCPDKSVDCKHVVAVAVKLLEGQEVSVVPSAPAPKAPPPAQAVTPRAVTNDPAAEQWLREIAKLDLAKPVGAGYYWALRAQGHQLHLAAYEKPEERQAKIGPVSWRALSRHYNDELIRMLDLQAVGWGNERAVSAGVMDVVRRNLGRGLDVVWADTLQPPVLETAELKFRIEHAMEGDRVRLSAKVMDGDRIVPPDALVTTDRVWAREGNALRPVELFPAPFTRLLFHPQLLATAAFERFRAEVEKIMAPFLAAPIPVHEYERVEPTRIVPVIRVRATDDRIEADRLVRYEFPFGKIELEPAAGKWSKPQEMWMEAFGKRIRFTKAAPVEDQVRALKKGFDVAHANHFQSFWNALEHESAERGIVLEDDGVRERFALHERPWRYEVSLDAEGDEFRLGLHLRSGDVTVDAAEMLKAWRQGDAGIRLPGLPGLTAIPEDLREFLIQWKNRYGGAEATSTVPLRQVFDLLADPSIPLRASGRWKTLLQRVRSFDRLAAVKASPRLKTELRPYQERGLAWLMFLREFELGGLLADDMGLGKTVQTLAFLDLVQKRSGPPTLILAPASVAINWEAECAKFVPHLRVEAPKKKVELAALEWKKADVVVLSYGLAVIARELLLEREYDVVVFDEAQALKNPRAERSRLARSLQARTRLALSGTPLENHLGEYQSILNVVMPGFLGDGNFFDEYYRYPIERMGNKERMAELRRQTAPLVLRRTKELVAPELPARSEVVQWVELPDAQRKLYDDMLGAYRLSIKKRISTEGFAKSKLHVLEVLLRLRQAACHPALLPPELAKDVEQSAKMEALQGLIDDALAGGHKVLIFSQFVSFLQIVRGMLPKEVGTAYLDGATRDRAGEIERFQKDEQCRLFLLSLHAGGRGINLTASEYVVFLEPWWNPAVEDQARDRAHRIGQTKHVFVYRLAAKNTVEEVILKLQEKKRALFQSLLADDEAPVAESLSRDDVAALFGMDVAELG
jgi:superfamily II DNA or RNA helicase